MDDIRELRLRVRSGLAWAAGTRFLGQAANWVLTLITIRFLHPEEYGLMAVIMFVIGFVHSFSHGGFADAIVQNREIDDRAMRSAFGLILVINAVCLVAVCALAYPTAFFYDDPRLIPLIQASSLLFAANAFQAMPRAILDRRLDVKMISRAELLSGLTGSSLTLALAVIGAGVWSLVIGMLLTSFLRVAALSYAAPYFHRPRFAFREISRILSIGGLRTGEGLLWYLCASVDILIVGKTLGAEALGLYSAARNLAFLPVEKLGLAIRPVAFPAFARLQYDHAIALGYLLKAIRLLAFAMFPVFFGISSVAPWITGIILGPKWEGATIPLALLALATTLRPLGLIIPPFLIGIGQFRASFQNTLLASILFPAAFLLGSYWGLLGVCVASLISYPIHSISLLRRVAIVTKHPIASLLRPLLPPLVGSLIMYIGVSMLKVVLPNDGQSIYSLMVLVIAGAAIYFSYALLFLRDTFKELLSVARR